MPEPVPAAPHVTALVAEGVKHAFNGFGPTRLVQLAPGEWAGEAIDVLILPCVTSATLRLTDPGLSDRHWSRLAATGAGVVFDASEEGREHAPQRTEALHRFLAEKGLSPSRAVYLTQERNYRADYLAHCARAGLEPMTVLEHDFWIWRFVAQFDGHGTKVFKRRFASFQQRLPRRGRRFMSLNLTSRPTKVMFLLSLLRDGLWDKGYISFGGFDRHAEVTGEDRPAFARAMRRLGGFEDLARELQPLLPELDAKGQVFFGLGEPGSKVTVDKAAALDPPVPEFDDCWFTVITETEMRARVSRITEKPLKPLVNFHPFVTFGNPGSLAMIRALGFETFADIIDESYDEELDPRRRFDMVYREVRRLCALDDAGLARMEARIRERLVHNARRGLIELPAEDRIRCLDNLLDSILAAVRSSAQELTA